MWQKHPKKCNGEKCLEKGEIIQQLKNFPLLFCLASGPHSNPILLGLGAVSGYSPIKLSSGLGQWLLKHLLGSCVWDREAGKAELLWCPDWGVWVLLHCEGKTSLVHHEPNQRHRRKEVSQGWWELEKKNPGYLEEEGISVWTDSLVRKRYKNKLHVLPNMTLQQHKVGINLEMTYWREYRVNLDPILCV